MALQARYRLQKNRDFQWVYRKGKPYATKTLVLLVLPVREKSLKIGFSVGKKNGGAVQRNRLKRRLKENIRPMLPRLKKGYRLVISARVGAELQDFHSLGKTLTHLLQRADLFVPLD